MINLYIYFYVMLILSILFYLMGLYLYYLELSIMFEWLIFNLNSLNVEMMILLDWVMCLFISVVMLISSMIMLYSMVYMSSDKYINRFISLLNLFIFSMVLMIMSPNLISILFGWDGLGLSSYCLVIYYQNYVSFNSGMVTVLCNRLGDVGLLMSIGLVFMYGSWNMYFLLGYKGELIMLMILLGGLTKSAQIPFSVWLPMAMAAPTPISALVHSSTLVTAGVYLLFRFNSFLISFESKKVVLYFSVFTMFMAGLMANFEMDLKKIIALSTLSQLGLMMMILSLGVKFLAFYHLLTHAVFKSLLFMCAGIMIHFMDNNQDIRFYGKLNEFLPFTMMSFYVSSLALMGFPFFAGFYSKDLIMEVIYMMNFNIFIMSFIVLSLMFTVSYSLRLMYYVFFSDFKGVSLYSIRENNLMNISMMMLLGMSIFGGALFFWICFFDNYFIYINLSVKLLTLGFMMMGVLLMNLLYMKNLIKIYVLTYFFSSMWMLSFLYLWIYKPFLNVGMKSFKMDLEWVEFVEKDLILKFMSGIKVNNNLHMMYMYMFIISMVFLVVFLK
uniref:NADH-ubiquinone oxidoreductase chain 5 n=1 Tax=Camponotus concavus TaxID=605056 RepID=A0A4D6NYG3_9HYME|nr:NADH dehydrogenase subunit 5 [Camponotus concavus]QCE31796.1 NADH dehydrogenase subunit 5 [Camponotus concavus]